MPKQPKVEPLHYIVQPKISYKQPKMQDSFQKKLKYKKIEETTENQKMDKQVRKKNLFQTLNPREKIEFILKLQEKVPQPECCITIQDVEIKCTIQSLKRNYVEVRKTATEDIMYLNVEEIKDVTMKDKDRD
ncbi:hypothetical protein LC087_01720 [Bacillus carboniphilus]|uniref:Spore coat protein CotO n=1 Tax=Bacillus carboniphilus TaxID=86663 RepID=A0ABY9JU94_9BACI|nr:CotO family spore coat protein [Bacillus carboniphilus]WLR42964.1 hypothetical protein LC087_01720 [Bacillus carboniphilus]